MYTFVAESLLAQIAQVLPLWMDTFIVALLSGKPTFVPNKETTSIMKKAINNYEPMQVPLLS